MKDFQIRRDKFPAPARYYAFSANLEVRPRIAGMRTKTGKGLTNIAVASSSTVPSRTANSIQVMNMAGALATLGNQVTLHCRSRDSEQIETSKSIHDYYGVPANFSIEKAPWQNRNLISALLYGFLTSKRILYERPDLLLSRNLLVSLIASLAGIPTVHESHHVEGAKSRIENLAFRGLVTSVGFRGVVVISSYLGAQLNYRYQLEPKKILVAHDGSTASSQRNSNLCLKSDVRRFRAGYSGSLYAGRGIEIIVALAEACPWADFTILGHFQQASPRQQGVPSNLTMSGFLEPSMVSRKLQEFDVLLAPYQTDTQDAAGNVTTEWMSPLKIFEYMAAGKAILASNLKALREVLVHGENCHLVEPDDLDGWVRALKLLAHDEEYRSTLGVRARDDQERNYTWRLRAEKIIAHSGIELTP